MFIYITLNIVLFWFPPKSIKYILWNYKWVSETHDKKYGEETLTHDHDKAICTKGAEQDSL